MAVQFKKFSQIQYDNFKEFSIQEYAKNIIKSNNYSEENALKMSEEEFNNILFQELDTPKNYLFSIINENEIHVGYIWYMIDNNGEAFICDFYINEDFRRKGYATQALELLDYQVKQHGCNEIVLNVFDYNVEANALYKKSGYMLSSIVEGGCRYLKKQLN